MGLESTLEKNQWCLRESLPQRDTRHKNPYYPRFYFGDFYFLISKLWPSSSKTVDDKIREIKSITFNYSTNNIQSIFKDNSLYSLLQQSGKIFWYSSSDSNFKTDQRSIFHTSEGEDITRHRAAFHASEGGHINQPSQTSNSAQATYNNDTNSSTRITGASIATPKGIVITYVPERKVILFTI